MAFRKLFSLALASIAACQVRLYDASARASAAGHRARDALHEFCALAFRVMLEFVARPDRLFLRRFTLARAAGPGLPYDGPPIHELRHEAGTSRRSAARNI